MVSISSFHYYESAQKNSGRDRVVSWYFVGALSVRHVRFADAYPNLINLLSPLSNSSASYYIPFIPVSSILIFLMKYALDQIGSIISRLEKSLIFFEGNSGIYFVQPIVQS